MSKPVTLFAQNLTSYSMILVNMKNYYLLKNDSLNYLFRLTALKFEKSNQPITESNEIINHLLNFRAKNCFINRPFQLLIVSKRYELLRFLNTP